MYLISKDYHEQRWLYHKYGKIQFIHYLYILIMHIHVRTVILKYLSFKRSTLKVRI